MSDDNEDTPFNSEPDYFPEIIGNDEHPGHDWPKLASEESTGKRTWQPEILQMMEDHGFSAEDFEDKELNTEELEEPKGEFSFFYGFTYPFADMTCHWHSTHSNSTRWELQDKDSRIEACLKGQSTAWLITKKKTDHYRQDISKADDKKMSAFDTPGPAKRKVHELQAEFEDPDTTGIEDREAASQGGEMKKPPKRVRRDDSDTAEGRETQAETGHQLGVSTEDPVLVKKPKRGRPFKSAVAIPVVASGSPQAPSPFNASVFVSIEQPPQLVRGKTHRTDKHVAQEPRVAGPFTLIRLMKWAEFLDEVAECVGVDIDYRYHSTVYLFT
jgi:hypothetical protein